MADNLNDSSTQQTDLFILMRKVRESVDSAGFHLFKLFKFLLKNIFIVLGLIILGAIAGYFLDRYKGDRYRHEIIVVPNFGSVNYLYEKVNGFDYEGKPIKFAKVEPITDVYGFIKARYQNLELAKYMSDNSIKYEKYQPNINVENFHRYHLLTIYSNKPDENGDVIDSFLKEFNQEVYYLDRQKIEDLTMDKTINEFTQSIENINQILDRLGEEENTKSDMSFNTYSELFQLVNVKKSMIEDLNSLKIQQFEQSKTIYDTSRIVNVIDNKFRYIVVLPILLFVMFLIVSFLSRVFKRYNTMNESIEKM